MTKDNIFLNIPCKPDYISLVRLTTSAIAHNLKLNIDEIEDIKVCIGEACVNVINQKNKDEISIQYEVKDDKLTIIVNDVSDTHRNDAEGFKEEELGLLIIKSLMDEVEFTEQGINMVKYIE
ncbi:MAG: ATP-binding protein [Tissierellaceae bacterium]|nr:ATP-binding protein [Tissierellaceae bacterium]